MPFIEYHGVDNHIFSFWKECGIDYGLVFQKKKLLKHTFLKSPTSTAMLVSYETKREADVQTCSKQCQQTDPKRLSKHTNVGENRQK